jgi:hypothetical protein
MSIQMSPRGYKYRSRDHLMVKNTSLNSEGTRFGTRNSSDSSDSEYSHIKVIRSNNFKCRFLDSSELLCSSWLIEYYERKAQGRRPLTSSFSSIPSHIYTACIFLPAGKPASFGRYFWHYLHTLF